MWVALYEGKMHVNASCKRTQIRLKAPETASEQTLSSDYFVKISHNILGCLTVHVDKERVQMLH